MKIKTIVILVLFVLLAAAILGPLSGQASAGGPRHAPAWAGEYAVDDDYTVALLHMDDDPRGFYDESDTSWSAWGDVAIDTNLYKFPSGSGIFDGNGDFLSTSVDGIFQFGSGNFTLDFWIYIPSTPAATEYLWWYGDEADTTDSISIALLTDQTIQLSLFEGSSGDTVTSSQTVPLTTWTHIAGVRSGSDLYTFVGGLSTYGTSSKTIGIPATNPVVQIGVRYGAGYREGYFAGHLDEFRVSKGIARWTSAFTPPGAEYESTPTDTATYTYTYTFTGSATATDTPTPTATSTETAVPTATETLTPTITNTPNYDILYLGTGTPVAIIEHSFTWGEASITIMMSLVCMVLVLGGLITFSIWAVAQRKK